MAKAVQQPLDDVESGTPTIRRTTCPISRDTFEEAARPLLVTIGDKQLVANVARVKGTGALGFSTGSIGWQANEKVVMLVDGIPTNCQVGLLITVIGSKDLPQ